MFDAVVLAGGSARRLGGIDKPALRIGPTTLLERVLTAVAGARRQVLVGPRPDGLDLAVIVCREQPVGGGPVAALAAGLAHVSSGTVVLLAADLPDVGPAVPALLGALDGDASLDAVALETAGRRNYLAAAWRNAALRTALDALGDPAGLPARRLYDGARVGWLPDEHGWGRDCDTWDDVVAARSRSGTSAGACATDAPRG